MILIKHELKQGWKSLAVWTASIGFFIIICVFLYPEMKGEMEDMNEMFSSMGAFSSAFGMDRLNFGTLIGFYAIECGNILGLGGAFFASLIAVSSLAKEEKEHTAEFLFAHPISRKRFSRKTDLCLVPASDIECNRVPVFRWIHFTDR